MYINYCADRQQQQYSCLKDLQTQKQLNQILILGVSFWVITMSENTFVSKDNTNQIIITKLRGGVLTESDDTDTAALTKLNCALKEEKNIEKLERNITSSSKSLNKICLKTINKIVSPLVNNPRLTKVLVELEKPVPYQKISPFSNGKFHSNVELSSPKVTTKDKTIKKKEGSSIFAEALMPLSLHKIGPFIVGSATASEMPDVADKFQTPFTNLITAREYIESSKSDIQYRDRFWQVIADTTIINGMCLTADDIGAFTAGAYANQVADRYMMEMVTTSATLTEQEKLNMEIFKQTAKEKGLDVDEVRGTGLMREFEPQWMKQNIWDRPQEGSRANSWDDPNDYNGNSSFD